MTHRRHRPGFTFLELIFVIVIMGILAKFGTEIFVNIYRAYNMSNVQNRLQSATELAMQQIANRLHYRIKDSVIARSNAATFQGLPSATGNERILEWVGYDIDGWQGSWRNGFNRPTWSGFIDVDAVDTANADFNTLFSPDSDTARINTVITDMRSNGSGTTFPNSAIFFIGANADVQTYFGWNGAAAAEQNATAAHRINYGAAAQQFDALVDDFQSVDIYEQYKLSWSAYAIAWEDTGVIGDGLGDLFLYYDYQPWEGEAYNNAVNITNRKQLLLENVDTFKFQAVGNMIMLQICVNDENIMGDGGYSLCKEQAIF